MTPPALPESFTRRITVQDDGCWLWSSFGGGGYGTYKAADGTTWRAHRFAYVACVGPVPSGLVLDHLCRVRHCVNPDHLEPVTQRTNMMRGIGPAKVNASKIACIRGHVFDEGNTYRATDGTRQCRACRAMHARNLRARRAQPERKAS